MEFIEAIKPWSAGLVAKTIGCPERIVYAWKKGERQPRPWVQKLIADRMKRVKSDASA